ncbi:MAG: polyhydroxyalkanoate synthesis regulator DNA-binding domain-containing protein [Bacillota bacterium]
MAEATGGPKRLELRKYPNRRYYDATRSRHVTLEEIHQLIRDGYEVQVADSKTGEDITAKVLAQIIIELDPPKLGVFPVALLHRLLRSNEQLVNDFVQRYFNQALTAFLDSQRSVEQYLRQAMGLQSPTPTVADWTKMMWGPFNPSLWSGQRGPAAEAGGPGTPTPPSPPPPPPGQDSQELRGLVDELRRQIAELQDQLGRSKKAQSKRTPQ